MKGTELGDDPSPPSEGEPPSLAQLAEQVSRIAKKLQDMANDSMPTDNAGVSPPASSVFDFRSTNNPESANRAPRSIKPPLPDPRLIRSIIRDRRLRTRFFEGELFADPAWDMLLDLTAAHAEYKRVSVTSLCLASGVPPTTALRWIAQLTEVGLIQRVDDEIDRRRAFLTLTDHAANAMARYFFEITKGSKGPFAI